MMIVLFSMLYGIVLIAVLALCTVAKESDELMEEEMLYMEAQKRLEAYYLKK